MNIVGYLATLAISVIPIIELRGAIPVAVFTFHLTYFEAFIISFIRKYYSSLFYSKIYKTNI